MKRIRGSLTFANVVACLALFIALGGASYAAFKLPPNSVGTKQLKKGAVTAAKVKPGSLLAKDFKKGQLPAGAVGPRGATGPQGVAGTNGEFSSTPLPHARIAHLSSDLPVTSGGAQNVTFDSVVEDNVGMADLTTRPSTLRIPRSGLYFVAGQLSWKGIEGTGRMGGSIVGLKDSTGSEFLRFRGVEAFAGGEAGLDYMSQPISEVIRLSEGQYVELIAYQQTGKTNKLTGEGNGSWLEATYLGP
jgi:hypothetical protein